ncbi:pyruvate dehydrogenase protein-like protein x component [Xylogone sp. PMI_703]|nr:pyruvate dehydrogenase protein-like protein x component [Xylogone sp. PMI_703]
MASFAAACRLSARLTARQLRQDVTARGFRTSAASLAAHNFTMPALSPTMTEGNIASWKVKEGDSFSAGDILLEIETDKASMDVEAQDDGVLAKIIQGDGSKGVQVGTRIGVLAEPGDDLSTLEIPPEDKSSAPPKQESAKSEAQSQPPPSSSSKSADAAPPAKKSPGQKAPKQTYPLYPSVEVLIHQLGLDASAIENMTPTGPNNRLLKGDVLAYVGSIPESYPAQLSSGIEKRSHLDLSNIKIVPSAPAPAKPSAAAAEPIVEEEALEVALPISLKAVLEVQKRIQSTLGVYLPLSTFIARATDVANDDLPRSKATKPTADELFDEILGLNTVDSEFGARGNFLPQITALPQTPLGQQASLPRKKLDIIDILAGKKQPSAVAVQSQSPVAGVSEVAPVSMFSVTVPKGDEERAEVFLERIRAVLEEEPGRLVL